MPRRLVADSRSGIFNIAGVLVFFTFTLDIAPNGAPFWLRFTGGEGVKEFLRINFETTNVLNEQVAQAAGFSITARTDINSVETALEAVSFANQQFAKATGGAP
jgi:hypothetical protein